MKNLNGAAYTPCQRSHIQPTTNLTALPRVSSVDNMADLTRWKWAFYCSTHCTNTRTFIQLDFNLYIVFSLRSRGAYLSRISF